MMRPPLSSPATALLRRLLDRSSLPRDRILLREFASTDWHSLTYEGERHRISLRIVPPDAKAAVDALLEGLEDAEFAVPGHVVADVHLVHPPIAAEDGSIGLELEALTIADR